MGRSQLSFFALPHEQINCLSSILTDANWILLWSALDRFTYRKILPREINAQNFNVGVEDEWMLFIGFVDVVSNPQFIPSDGRYTLDFAASCAVQYVPSFVANDNILLEGRLAIMRNSCYSCEPVLQKTFVNRYAELRSSVTTCVKCEGAMLTQVTTNGIKKILKSVAVSQGAAQWRTNGNSLKQFICGQVEFGVEGVAP